MSGTGIVAASLEKHLRSNYLHPLLAVRDRPTHYRPYLFARTQTHRRFAYLVGGLGTLQRGSPQILLFIPGSIAFPIFSTIL
jgi:hypothetical protein